MRAILERLPRIRPFSSWPAPVLVTAVGVMLAGCQTDSPSGVAPDTSADVPALAFPIVTGAAHAAAMSTNRLVRTLATLQPLGESRAGVTSSGLIVNSPWDLTYVGGPVITSATSQNVYVNCPSTPASCWGTGSLSPATFLRDLNNSELIEVANQYLGEDAQGQFRVASLSTTATFSGNTATINDIFEILFSASTFIGASGYNNIFHVFLPQGTDICITSTNCYSPDNPATFAFCAFHGSVDFGPNQHVIFSVEPYEAVGGCALPAQNRVIDATASALSHEFFESITDPDLNAWFNLLNGNEVGDLCFAFRNPGRIGSRSYVVQEEYSNARHACTNGG